MFSVVYGLLSDQIIKYKEGAFQPVFVEEQLKEFTAA
jgi:hypothetical protein